ncbi:MAG: DUF3472 domain-containing protein [Bacteroidota bacterium]|nr:DUF3472 domain-containing protein [Bacteroidota bacterium]
MLRSLFCLLSLISIGLVQSQTIHIPAYTGYSVPAEADESPMFSEKNGLHWTDAQRQVFYYFHVAHPGSAELQLSVRNPTGTGKLAVSVAGAHFTVSVPRSAKTVQLKLGKVSFPATGFYTLQLNATGHTGPVIADLQSIDLSGDAVEGLHFNPKPRRNAASVHLKYPLPDSVKAIAFYNEVTIPAGADIVHSYYMACGFARGYFGIQVNSPTERRVIFSVWDSGNEAVDRNKVADSNKVQLLAKGEGVVAEGFGNEGTGGHSHWVYPWKTGITYRLLVTALPDSATQTTIYSGYFYLPETKRWKLIACFQAPHDGNYLRNLYSFNEDFVGVNGQLQRKAFFGNQWVQRRNGSFKELTESLFSYDATGKAGDRIDYGGGVEDGKFYLWNGGFKTSNAQFGDRFIREAGGVIPAVEFNRNADSAFEAQKEQAMILAAIKNKQLDTTGSMEGVYYTILTEGTGEHPVKTDTVSVFYKGSLLANGTVFDQTRDKPASFPLNRLIRGWQLALPYCRVGGKIRIVIPSSQAYGIRARSHSIPPNSILVFDVELTGIKK